MQKMTFYLVDNGEGEGEIFAYLEFLIQRILELATYDAKWSLVNNATWVGVFKVECECGYEEVLPPLYEGHVRIKYDSQNKPTSIFYHTDGVANDHVPEEFIGQWFEFPKDYNMELIAETECY
jgi:hypothetical protein